MENKLYVLGTGPGDIQFICQKGISVLSECDIIVGYTVYADLLREKFPGKEFITTSMKEEEKRCRMAFGEASKGKKVVMVCSGDAGIYGMSSLMFEIGVNYPGIEVEVIPGITAASSGGALIGAPLANDFAVISLSDRLTPWEKIEKRLELAAEADFAICIYNPASRNRPDHLWRACDILMKILPRERICGIARNIGREGETFKICTLFELKNMRTDMFTTVFIGNSMTKVINGRMVTPRGYRIET